MSVHKDLVTYNTARKSNERESPKMGQKSGGSPVDEEQDYSSLSTSFSTYLPDSASVD